MPSTDRKKPTSNSAGRNDGRTNAPRSSQHDRATAGQTDQPRRPALPLLECLLQIGRSRHRTRQGGMMGGPMPPDPVNTTELLLVKPISPDDRPYPCWNAFYRSEEADIELGREE